MRLNNVTPKQAIKRIKEELDDNKMYNGNMNEVKIEKIPEWAKVLIKSVDNIGIKVDNLESKVDKNTEMIKQAHPELFNKKK